MTSRQFVQALLIAALGTSMGLSSQAQQYNLSSVSAGYPGQVLYDTIPRVNNQGQVVGIVAGSGAGYLFSGGVTTPLPSGFSALDINNNGVVAMTDGLHSFISVPPFTTVTSMGSFPPCSILGTTAATGLNDSGAAVGVANFPTDCPQAFFSFNGVMTALGPGHPEVRWMAINNSNQIVGYWQDGTGPPRAVQLINGTLTDLDPSNATAYGSEAMAINDAGQFIVNSNEAFCTKTLGPPTFKKITYVCSGQNWFPLLFSGGTSTNLGALGAYGGTATGINRWGDVVGTSQTAPGVWHAFLYSAGSMTDLNSYSIGNGLGWTIQQAYDINDVGQIVALGKDFRGNPGVVLLSPAGTPPALVSLTLNPTTVFGGIVGTGTSTGTVTLSGAAPAGGVIVSLSSNNNVAHVPTTIRVNQGSTTASFTITTSATIGSVSVTISATAGSTTKTALLTVTDVGS